MKRFLSLFFILAITFGLPSSAQKNKQKAASSVPVQTSEQLIQTYHFSEAAKQLQREISTTRSAKKSTERLEEDLRRANLGIDLLKGIEKVTFVDSFKVLRNDITDIIRLSSEAGKISESKKEISRLSSSPEYLGETVYINELGDKIFYASCDTSNDVLQICEAYNVGDKWTNAHPLEGIENEEQEQDYPFMMPDGVTLYFAAQGEESLGGYDLFVTRYNSDTKQFLKAENLGMPFNSPANDYLLCIDEGNALGWLVSDRFQTGDTVCIYVFIPSESREIYESDELSSDELIQFASIHSVAATQTDDELVENARKRLQQLLNGGLNNESGKLRHYVINDNTVYTSLLDFKNCRALAFAKKADELAEKLRQTNERRDELAKLFTQNPQAKKQSLILELKELNSLSISLSSELRETEKQMRKAELGI